MNVINKGHTILLEEGFKQFIRLSVSFAYRNSIRRYLPNDGEVTYNGVKTGENKKPLDPYLLATGIDKPNQEDGIASSHRKHTQEGDTVNVVAGGNGVTAVIAARIVGENGLIRIYEGGGQRVEAIRDTIVMNGVEDRCEVHHAVVGRDIDVYGGTVATATEIDPLDLSDCDVLELDCEGSEIDILERIENPPNTLIIEIHPWNFQKDPEYLFELLNNNGYEIQSRYGHDGVVLSDGEFEELYEKSILYAERVAETLNPPHDYRHIESGARWPVVIAAVQTGS